jgi:hypothetical protein
MCDNSITATSVALLKAEDAFDAATVKIVRVADQVVGHLLIDGLAALRAGDTHITDEYLDRAIRQIQGALRARIDANDARVDALNADRVARGLPAL